MGLPAPPQVSPRDAAARAATVALRRGAVYSIAFAEKSRDRRTCDRRVLERMPDNLLALEDLPPRLGHLQRIVGLDLGTKTIGVAVSDVERRIATPAITIRRTKFGQDAKALLEAVKTYDLAAFVIGLPLNMDGTEGPRVQATRAFIRNMAPLTPTPFVFWDERLSTAAMTRVLIDQDVSRAKRAQVIDRMAAAYILQGALDRLARLALEANERPLSPP